jgi:hypothetical protein
MIFVPSKKRGIGMIRDRLVRIAALVLTLSLVGAISSTCEEIDHSQFGVGTLFQDCSSDDPLNLIHCYGFLFGNYVAVATSPTEIYCSDTPTAQDLRKAFLLWYLATGSEEKKLNHLWLAWIAVGFCVDKTQPTTEKDLLQQDPQTLEIH